MINRLTIVFIFLIASASSVAQPSVNVIQYEKDYQTRNWFTWWDAGALTCGIASGLGRGVTNALRKDNSSLQRYLGVGDYDWGGRMDWQRNYKGNRYWNEATNSPNPHKTEVLGNFGRDGWHTADEVAKWGDRLGAACFVIGSALDINRVARIEYTSASAKKKAIRRQIIISAAKGVTTWAISSLVEKRTFEAITKSK